MRTPLILQRNRRAGVSYLREQRRAMMTASMESGEAVTGSRLGEAYVRFAPSGIRLAYLLTGDRAIAEDLVQEAFLRFVGRLHYLRDPDALDTYLRRTIVNLSKNYFRRRAAERSYLERHSGQRQPEHPDPDVPSYETMRAALLGLPARQRAAIVLRYYEDLSESEIAEILRCRPATVRSLVSRGVQALRRTPEVIQ
jgi:RNA polymerase sigma-70 factor (sigma-E family)